MEPTKPQQPIPQRFHIPTDKFPIEGLVLGGELRACIAAARRTWDPERVWKNGERVAVVWMREKTPEQKLIDGLKK